ncbi:1-(5-phosphoribosyl)-5-((5-phosphoribosylamino)methylideneamino) imidazole-4-carboxamide isomerase [Desulfarculales bacterium]
MEAIPTVDLKGGRCVRLRQGRMEDETVFSDDPVSMVRHWQNLGARRLHVVNLDGAVGGRPANAVAICQALEIPVQLGGGVRDLADLESALALGVDLVILGTLAARNPLAALFLVHRHSGAVQGWTESSGKDYLELAALFDRPEVAALVFTDITRDGMHSGPNLNSTRRLCQYVNHPVIAAGGVHRLLELAPLGRAIYEGTLDLAQAQVQAEQAC